MNVQAEDPQTKIERPVHFRWRLTEFVLLYVGIPFLLTIFLPARMLLPCLWIMCIGVLFYMRRDRSFNSRSLISWTGLRYFVRKPLPRIFLAALLLTGSLALYRPAQLLRLPRSSLMLWLTIMLLYPLLSVAPQALIFRSLYLHRYGGLFSRRSVRIGVGALVFSLAHLPFLNLWSLVLTAPGGWFFLDTYERTGSLPLSWLEHAIYGNLIFTLGWGAWFYHGGTQALLAS